jgi:hypothetical protein
MEAIEFVVNYPNYVDMLDKVVKDEYKSCIEKLRNLDPHDIVTPESYIMSETSAMGLVFALFQVEVKKLN